MVKQVIKTLIKGQPDLFDHMRLNPLTKDLRNSIALMVQSKNNLINAIHERLLIECQWKKTDNTDNKELKKTLC